MPSKSQEVRDALTTEIRKVSGIGTTGYDWQVWKDVNRFPAVFTILDSDDKERSPTRSKSVLARFRLACVLQSEHPEDDFDTLRGAIETQIEDDPSLGNLVLDAWVSGCTAFATAKNISGTVYVRDILVDVEYRHDRGAP